MWYFKCDKNYSKGVLRKFSATDEVAAIFVCYLFVTTFAYQVMIPSVYTTRDHIQYTLLTCEIHKIYVIE